MTRRSPLLEITLGHLRLAFREPSTVFWTFGFPILLSVALGIAFRNRPPEPVLAVVVEGSGAAPLVQALEKAPDVAVSLLPEPQARQALRTGKAALLVRAGAPRLYEFDPTRPESRLARSVVDDALQRAEGRADPTAIIDKPVTEPGSRYIDFLLPGLIGLNLLSSGMWGVGWTIVEMRTRKLLKRLLATPMRRRDFLLSFVLMRLVYLFLELPVLLGFGVLAFDVPVRGSLALVVGLALLGALSFSGIGVLVASRAKNTQTVSGLINLVMMPMFLLSGVFFSAGNFPDVMQPFIRALPLTAFNDALRAVMLEGAGLAQVWGQAALLAGIAVVSFGVALRVFRWS